MYYKQSDGIRSTTMRDLPGAYRVERKRDLRIVAHGGIDTLVCPFLCTLAKRGLSVILIRSELRYLKVFDQG